MAYDPTETRPDEGNNAAPAGTILRGNKKLVPEETILQPNEKLVPTRRKTISDG